MFMKINKIILGRYPVKFWEPLDTDLKKQLLKEWIVGMLPLFKTEAAAKKLVGKDWYYKMQ